MADDALSHRVDEVGVDWRELATRLLPSDDARASPLQRARHALYREYVLPSLDRWLEPIGAEHKWPVDARVGYRDYLVSCAWAGAMRALDPARRDVALGLAMHSMMLSTIDPLLDEVVLPDLLRSDGPLADRITCLDSVLWSLCGPLLDRAAVSEATTERLLGASRVHREGHDAFLEVAVQSIELFLDELPRSPGREVYCREFVAALGRQRNEVVWALEFAERRTLPDIETYLRRSWGYLELILAACYTLQPEVAEMGAWERWRPVAEAFGKLARLLNDRGSFAREQQAHEVSSITVMLASLGYEVGEPYAVGARPLTHALEAHRALVHAHLQSFMVAFESVHPPDRPPIPQSHLLAGTAAYYLATYDHTDFADGLEQLGQLQREQMS